jgi:hypothetical protein
MRILVVVIALAGALAFPSVGDAASKKKSKAKPRPASVAQQVPSWQFYGDPSEPARSPNRAWDVWVNGDYRGSDPDPNVRSDLARIDPFADSND